MAEVTKDVVTQQDTPRWRKLLNLPDDTLLVDISTGARHRVGDLIPLHTYDHGVGVKDCQCQVQEFRLKGADTRVWVSFLRLESDASRVRHIDSLMPPAQVRAKR